MIGQASVIRATALVAFAAVLEASLAPLLSVNWVGPRFTIIAIVVAAMGLKEMQGMLVGFFGGVLTDALSSGLFGTGALGGLIAGALAVRVGIGGRKAQARAAIARVTATSVAVYDIIGWAASGLSGEGGPSIWSYLFLGVLPDVLLNTLLVFLFGGLLLRLVSKKGDRP